MEAYWCVHPGYPTDESLLVYTQVTLSYSIQMEDTQVTLSYSIQMEAYWCVHPGYPILFYTDGSLLVYTQVTLSYSIQMEVYWCVHQWTHYSWRYLISKQQGR